MKGAQEGVTRREGEGGEIRGGAKKAVTFAITEVHTAVIYYFYLFVTRETFKLEPENLKNQVSRHTCYLGPPYPGLESK